MPEKIGNPHNLEKYWIDKIVMKGLPGNYLLGNTKKDEEGEYFDVLYVGRSDKDLNRRLHEHAIEKKYKQFIASCASNPSEAFEKECHYYHTFGEEHLDNRHHPDSPEGLNLNCPVCN